MADPNSLKNDMHTATGLSQIYSLRGQADAFLLTSTGFLPYFIDHVYREYNMQVFRFSGTGMILPTDGGLRPTGYGV